MERDGNPLLPKDKRFQRTDNARKVAKLPSLEPIRKDLSNVDDYLTQWLKDVDDLLK